MGNSALYKKMETASDAIKRDIVFAASLYVTGVWFQLSGILNNVPYIALYTPLEKQVEHTDIFSCILY